MKKLHLGCGKDIKKGYINLDKIELKGVNVIHDLNKFPYPFKDNTFDEILSWGVLEHLDDLVKVMRELHRILKIDGVLKTRVPYFNNITAYADPTHRHFFTLNTMDYFTDNCHFNFYTNYKFIIIKKKLIPTNLGKFIPYKLLNKAGVVSGIFVKAIYFEMIKRR